MDMVLKYTTFVKHKDGLIYPDKISECSEFLEYFVYPYQDFIYLVERTSNWYEIFIVCAVLEAQTEIKMV